MLAKPFFRKALAKGPFQRIYIFILLLLLIIILILILILILLFILILLILMGLDFDLLHLFIFITSEIMAQFLRILEQDPDAGHVASVGAPRISTENRGTHGNPRS